MSEPKKDIFHVLPINDLKPHIESAHCLCEPRVEEDGCLIIHNAYDGRDRQEQYLEKTKLSD